MVCRSSESVGEELTICWNWLTHVALQGLGLGRGYGLDLSTVSHSAVMNGVIWVKFAKFDALVALGEDEEALVRHLDHFVDGGAGADVVQVGGLRHVLAGVALGDDQDGLLLAERLDELDGALAADSERQYRVGEEDGVAHGQDRDGPASSGHVFWLALRF